MGILGKLFGLFRKKDEAGFSIKFDYFDPSANRKFTSLDLHEGQVISREIIDFPRETSIKLKPKIWIIEDPRLGNGNRRIITHIEDLMKGKEKYLCKVWGESIYGNSLYLRQGSQVLAYYGDDNARGYITTVYTLKLTPDLDYIITKKDISSNMGLLIKQLKKLFKIKEKNEMKEPNSLKNYFYLASPGCLISELKTWNKERIKCKSQLFVYGDVKSGRIYRVMSVNDYKPLCRLGFNEPTKILFYVRLSEDTSDYIIKDHCCCEHDLDSFLERHIPEHILSRIKNDRDIVNKLMATWKNLITDPTTKPMITNSGTTKFGDTIQLDEYGNITTRP